MIHERTVGTNSALLLLPASGAQTRVRATWGASGGADPLRWSSTRTAASRHGTHSEGTMKTREDDIAPEDRGRKFAGTGAERGDHIGDKGGSETGSEGWACEMEALGHGRLCSALCQRRRW